MDRHQRWRAPAQRLQARERQRAAALQPVRAVYEHRDGVLWAATDGAGLVRLRGQSLETSPLNAQLLSPYARLAGDAAGNLWLGSIEGLSRIAPDGRVRIISGRRTGCPAPSSSRWTPRAGRIVDRHHARSGLDRGASGSGGPTAAAWTCARSTSAGRAPLGRPAQRPALPDPQSCCPATARPCRRRAFSPSAPWPTAACARHQSRPGALARRALAAYAERRSCPPAGLRHPRRRRRGALAQHQPRAAACRAGRYRRL